VKRHYKQI